MEPKMDCTLGNEDNFVNYTLELKKYSTKLTAGAGLTIPPTVYGALSMVSRNILSRHSAVVGINAQLWCPLHLENFLCLSQGNETIYDFKSNSVFIRQGIYEVLDNKDNLALRSLLLNQRNTKLSPEDYWKTVRTGLEADFFKYDYPGPSKSASNKANKTCCNIRFAWVVVFYHACIYDISRVNLIPRLFKAPNPSHPQAGTDTLYRLAMHHITGHDWIRYHIFEVHQALVKCASCKVDFETWIIDRLKKERTSDKAGTREFHNATWKAKMIREGDAFNHQFQDWDPVGDVTVACMSTWIAEEKMNPVAGNTKASSLRSRLKSILHAGLLFDIIETHLEYGPDPILPAPPKDERDNLALFRKYQK